MLLENPFHDNSSEQLASVLNNAPVAVIVSSAENRELLYANDPACRLFAQTEYRPGLTCYEAAGNEKPCAYCQYEKLNREEFFVRNHMDPVRHRIFQLSGKLIDWDGKPACMEYIMDVTDTQIKEEQIRVQSEEMQRTFQSLPCGLSVYQYVDGVISPIFHNPVFYEIMGYSEEDILQIEQKTDFLGVHPEDALALKREIGRAIQNNGVVNYDYRVWNSRKQQYGCIHLQGVVKPQEDGTKLLYGVYSDVSEQRRLESALEEARLEMDHLINSIPGGIASYQIEGKKVVPTFVSKGLLALSGHTREEYKELVKDDIIHAIYEADRSRVLAAAYAAMESGQLLDISYRTRHKDGHLVWVHVNGRRIGPKSETMRFYAVFTGMSAEAQLFQNIANETADRIYVIDKESYELLYANESKEFLCQQTDCVGQKCYRVLFGKEEPCEFCTLKKHAPDGRIHDMGYQGDGHFYSTRFRETLWNGIPAYVKYVQDVTEEVQTQKEKEHLEQYFQTMVRKLPGGVVVVRVEKDGRKVPEYFSDGYAAMSGMTMEELWENYGEDGMSGVHPDDVEQLNRDVEAFIASGEEQGEFIFRMKRGDNSYLWIKNTASIIQREDGEYVLYTSYNDITKEREEQELIRQQYKDLILQHYRMPGPNALIVGHCNITRSRILEISDYTGSGLLETFGAERNEFFTGISTLVVDEEERQAFLDRFLNEPTLAAFRAGNTEIELDCFVKLPREVSGRYVKFKVVLVEAPDTGDITGILTVYDITEQTISDRNLHQLSTSGYDLIADVDLLRDSSRIVSGNLSEGDVPGSVGRHTDRLELMIREQVVPKDKALFAKMMEPAYMMERLKQQGTYSFSYTVIGRDGENLTKKLTVSAADLRLGRVCLARADITDSVREQQGLLNAVAYTFEQLGIIHVNTRSLTLYTRQTVQQSLPPKQCDYEVWYDNIRKRYVPDEGVEMVEQYFGLPNMLVWLEKQPEGYDFVLPYQEYEGLRYKQVNVVWGDRDHETVCVVRQDVTEMLAAERQSQEALEKALELAREASRAKSDFLTSMSHDIRTPMNAIMGMTALAEAHLGEQDKVESCLQKISLSSRHLLSLINDILDMSKIERSKITLNHVRIFLPELVEQLSAMMGQQAEAAGLDFCVKTAAITHPCFYGDSLRVNQILINILSNAIKFTSKGGTVTFLSEEIPAVNRAGGVRYRFTIRDTGIGMSEEFLTHLFEPFTRGRNVSRVEGTGLGLSITKGLVDLMNGDLSVESREQAGTTFRVELEFEAAKEEAGTCQEKPFGNAVHTGERGIDGRCFLVAEDNEINAEILCELLQMYGAKAVVKQNGAQAVREFQEAGPGTYDAILMDIQMPEMNGYEAARAVRNLEREDSRRIPIIAMTANAFTEDIQAAMEAGMNAHIAKPIDMKVFIETLDKLLT